MASASNRRSGRSASATLDSSGSPSAHSPVALWLTLSEFDSEQRASVWLKTLSTAELASLCLAVNGFASSSRPKLVTHVLSTHAWMHKYRVLCSLEKLGVCQRSFEKKAVAWMPKGSAVNIAWDSAATIVQEESGSAVRVAPGLYLTCAHCVCHIDDPEEDDEAPSADVVPRVGRLKLLVTSHGEWTVTECIRADAASDLALLRTVVSTLPPGAGASSGRFVHPPAVVRGGAVLATDDRSRVVCVGNPSAFDLESEEAGATIEFQPPVFHTSTGRLAGETRADRRARFGLGPLQHTAWTYWGHSGAPLIDTQGALVGLHNSWDAGKGTRHGVDAAAIRAFLIAAGLL